MMKFLSKDTSVVWKTEQQITAIYVILLLSWYFNFGFILVSHFRLLSGKFCVYSVLSISADNEKFEATKVETISCV